MTQKKTHMVHAVLTSAQRRRLFGIVSALLCLSTSYPAWAQSPTSNESSSDPVIVTRPPTDTDSPIETGSTRPPIETPQAVIETLDADVGRPERVAPSNGSSVTVLRPAGLVIASFDRNGDYIIDVEEFKTGVEQTFETIDSDKSGFIRLIEINTWRERALGSIDAHPRPLFFDTDINQSITRREFDDAMERIYTDTDKNEDGLLSFSELIRPMPRPIKRITRAPLRPTPPSPRQQNRRR